MESISASLKHPISEDNYPIVIAESHLNNISARAISVYDPEIKQHASTIMPSLSTIQSYGIDMLIVINEYAADNMEKLFSILDAFSKLRTAKEIPAIIMIKEEDISRMHNTLIFADFIRDPSLDNEHGVAYTVSL